MTDNKCKDTRKILWEAWKKMGKLKGRNRLEGKYIGKMQYMLFFLSTIKCKKKFLDNWELPDYNWLNKISE